MREDVKSVVAAELPALRRFGYASCADWHRADDLVQAALERMYLVWPRLVPDDFDADVRAPSWTPVVPNLLFEG